MCWFRVPLPDSLAFLVDGVDSHRETPQGARGIQEKPRPREDKFDARATGCRQPNVEEANVIREMTGMLCSDDASDV